MGTVTVRNLPDEVHRALRVRAAEHGRSTEAEIRAILQSTVCPPERILMGKALLALAGERGLTDHEAAAMEKTRDKSAAEPLRFE